jgi:ElaB/YqjD/DUF883 family membrane-anchored ribosome-binding protein
MTNRERSELIEGGPGDVDPEVARAEARIAEARDRVARSMLALRQEVRRRTDWRGWVRRQPVTALGAALAVGLILGWRAGRARGSR